MHIFWSETPITMINGTGLVPSKSQRLLRDGGAVVRGFVQTPPTVVNYMVDRLFRARPPRRSDNVLDPGCGTGQFLAGIIRWYMRHHSELPNLVGIESQPDRARQARIAFSSVPEIEIRECDFLTEPVESFDFIVGNPPYVPITRLSEAEKENLRGAYETARGRFDLYLLFFERALRSLKPDGRMVFITPEKFLYVATAAPLRRLLSNVQVEEIRLVNEQVFDGLVTYPTITTILNRPARKTTVVALRDQVERRCHLKGNGDSWMPLIQGAPDLQQGGLTLKDLCIRISAGVATGADEVFIRKKRELEPTLAEFARPCVAGRELNNPGEVKQTEYVILLPYTEIGGLLDERKLGALGQYLASVAIRERLMKRTCVRRKPWYAFHETPPLAEILSPKILCKDIAKKPYFWIDRKGDLIPRHSVYYIVPEDVAILDRLCAHLNSSQIREWLSQHCQRAANGFLRLQSAILKKIPAPEELKTNVERGPSLIGRTSYVLPGLLFKRLYDGNAVR
jgi:adenine-specific DNA-methyltransferase